MGNCLKKHSSSEWEWAGEDWGSPARESNYLSNSDHQKNQEKEVKVDDATAVTEVKIKITKKQLEELLGKTDVQGLTVEEVLSHLIKVSDRVESNQRSWRPALQSIPEND